MYSTGYHLPKAHNESREAHMNTLVLGGTGTVGSKVVQELLARGAGEVRVLTRDVRKVERCPPVW